MALRASRCYPVRAPQMNTEHCSDLKDQEVLRALAGCIDFDVLAPGLERNGVLTKSAVYKIKVEESLFERNLCLLQQLPRRGSWAYERFVDLLLENRMFQAAQALTQSKLPITPTPPNPRANGGRNVHHGLMHRMLWRAPLLLPVLSNNGAAATLDSRDDYLFPRMKFAFDEDIWGSQLAAAGTCACANGEAAPVDSSVTNPSRGTKCTYDEGIIWGRTLATTGACGKGDGPNTSGEASEAELRIARASCWKLGDHIYRMSRKPRGQCIIINNKEFGRHAEQRENSELDVYRMEALFTALHFECSVYSDISAKEMKALLSQAARQDQLDQVECFAAVLMSHGREDVIDGADGDELNLHSDVYELFSNENCPSLQGKPKLFFIQACRGDMLDRGVSCIAPATRNDHPLVTSSSLEWPAVCEYKHRMCSDMFIAYATAPGYVALKNMTLRTGARKAKTSSAAGHPSNDVEDGDDCENCECYSEVCAHAIDPKDGRIKGIVALMFIVPALLRRGVLETADIEAIQIYPVRRRPRGICLIINNSHFEDPGALRKGSDMDVQRMVALFRALHFNCCVFNNLTADEMAQVLLWLVKLEQLEDADILAVHLMSHGAENTVYGVDGNQLHLEGGVYELFSNKNCPTLQGKPKLFFVEACRGVIFDNGVHDVHRTDEANLTADALRITSNSSTMSPSCVQAQASGRSDMFILHATAPGHAAFMGSENGSWFFQGVYNVFAELASRKDLEAISRKTESDIRKRTSIGGAKQTTHVEKSGWGKKLYFSPGQPAETTS